MKRPLRHINGCLSCDGLGVWTDEDWDEEAGCRVVPVRCLDCDGSGLVSDCIICDEPTAVTTLEWWGGRCGACVAAKETAS